MAGFHLYTSNDQSALAASLGKTFREHHLTRVLEPERIVVQSTGMKRWISLQLAGQLGILANCSFLFPNQLLTDIFECVVPEFRKRNLLDREIVTWKILELLPNQLEKPLFSGLKNYLFEAGCLSQIKTWQLARKIAYLFDQYCMYRPEMIMAWDSGQGKHWQADLWRTLGKDGPVSHLPALRKAFFDRIRDPAFRSELLPERVTVFGITSLPPLHIEVLAALSHVIDIHLYFLNPSPEYWGDIMSGKEVARQMRRQIDPDLTESELHMDQGNPLLATFGRTGRSFFQLLQQNDFNTVLDKDFFRKPFDKTQLSAIQSDIFRLADPALDEYPDRSYSADDHSLQIHSCHSPMREIEVLHDQLKLMMTRQPTLKPGDILVMAPDINIYAPIIKAVFSSSEGGARPLPFSIADRNYHHESRIIQWFLKLLSLSHSRFRISEIFELLESEAILARYTIARRDIPLLQDWLRSVNIRWGINTTHKQSAGTPEIHQNTWEFGLDRILLGLAMPDDDGHPYRGILPFDRIEGSQGELLGKFLSFFSNLKKLVQPSIEMAASGHLPIDTPRPLTEWSLYLQQLVLTFFDENEQWDEELQTLKNAIDQLDTFGSKQGFGGNVELEVVRDHLSDTMEQGNDGFGFLGSGITFCSMLPMRSIPFKVVALLGLNEQAFPRNSQPLSFDLIAAHPRPGDRSLKEDDRYLFLEAIISARENLYISYIGQNINDNSRIPPSVLVSELIQYLETAEKRLPEEISAPITVRHRLQAFNPQYFSTTAGPSSFSADNLEAAQILANKPTEAPAGFINKLPEPEGPQQPIDIQQLITFFSNPSKFLLSQRLGLSLEERLEKIEDTEPFSLDRLERYQLDRMLVENRLTEQPWQEVREQFQASGALPPEAVGNACFRQELESSERFVESLRPFLQEKPSPPLTIEVDINGWCLSGTIDHLYPTGLIHYRMARIKTKDRIASWLNWLLLNLPNAELPVTQCILAGLDAKGRDQLLFGKTVENPKEQLSNLLALFQEGQIRPLPFFPSASEAYVHTLRNKPEKAMQEAEKQWRGNDWYREKDDPWFSRCFGHIHPLDDEFRRVSRAILDPIFSHYSDK
jgi:exodeoxyribonuclease V gamma subunit